MAVPVVVAALALVAAVLVGATWRRAVDERQSVKDHQRTLDTLRHLPDRRVGGVRATGPAPAVPAAKRRPQPAAPVARRESALSGRTDQAPGARARRSAGRTSTASASPKADTGTRPVVVFADDASPASSTNGRDTAESKTNVGEEYWEAGADDRPSDVVDTRVISAPRPYRFYRLPRAALMTIAAVVVAAGAVGLALALVPSGTHTSGGSAHTIASGRHHHATTPAVITPTVSGLFSATYAAPAGSYTVELDASGPCWVMATDTATNHVVWTGTMSAGERRQLPANGGLVVRLGAANVAVSLDGKPVQLPASFRSPFDLTFRPA